MSEPNPESKTPPPKRRRRWLRRVLLVFLALITLVAIFHRPILRFVITEVGARVAAGQGIDLEWEVRGSVLGDLGLTRVQAGGGEGHWLQDLEVGELGLEYDLGAVIRGSREKAVQSLKLRDGNAVVDLRNLPVPKPKVKKTPSNKAPPLVWPDTIDIDNLNTKLTLASGQSLDVQGLTLRIGKDMPGEFSAKALRLPSGLSLGPVKAKVQWSDRNLIIRDLELPQGIKVEEFAADLAQWPEGTLGAKANVRLNEARAEIEAGVENLWTGTRNLRADVKVRALDSEDLAAWGLPDEVVFRDAQVDLQVSGDVQNTSTLKAAAAISAAEISAAGVMLDRLQARVELDQGRVTLGETRLTRANNTVTATGGAKLPPNLAEWKKIDWQASVAAQLPTVADLLVAPPPVAGEFSLEVKAQGQGPTPTQVIGELRAQQPAFDKYQLPQLGVTFSMDGRQARVELPGLTIGDGNSVTLRAALTLEDAMPVTVEWDFTLGNPEALLDAAGLPPLPQPVTGTVASTGSASFDVADLREKKWDEIAAKFRVNGADLTYGAGKVRELNLEGELSKGTGEVKTLAVEFDNQNSVTLEGSVGIATPFAFTARGAVNLAELTRLNGLLKAFKAPALASGSLLGALDAEGALQPLTANGKVQLTAVKVRTEAMPDAADAVIDATFADKRAELARLHLNLGPWEVDASGMVDERHADLPRLEVRRGQTRLLSGRARVPFNLLDASAAGASAMPMDVAISANDLRIDELLASFGVKNIPGGILNANVTLGGRGGGINGDVRVTVRDIRVPQAPKSFQPASVTLNAELGQGRASLDARVVQEPLQPITLTANVPLNLLEAARQPDKLLDAPLDARLDMPETDLGFLAEYAPDLIRSLPARASIQAAVTGTVKNPQLSADISASAPEIGWRKPDLPSVRDLQVRISARDRLIRVEQVSVVLAGGRVRVSGVVDAQNLTQPTVDLRVEAFQALVYRNPETSLRADGVITARGTLQAAQVSGQVDLVRGRLFKEIDFMPALSLPSDVPPLPPDTGRSESRVALPEFMAQWTFDVRVRTRDPFIIAGNVANGAITVAVNLTGTGAQPILAGGATVDRMVLRLPYSAVKVVQGDITVNPAKPFDPALDIRAESRVGSTDVTIYVYGDSSDPKTRFTSIPPMPEADVVTLLATGTTLSGSSDEVAADAAGRAIFLFLNEIYRKIFNQKKRVDDEPPRMRVTLNPAGGTDRSSNNVQVTYELTDRIQATARFGQDGRVRGFLAYLLRFGKAARAVDEQRPLPAGSQIR